MFINVAAYLKKQKKLTNFSVKWTLQRSSSCWHSPFPEDGDLYHSIVCIDQFSKRVQANPVKDKDTLDTAQSLYKIICFCGCFEIKINKQSIRKLAPKELHALTRAEQGITSTYHLQHSKLVERQDGSITKRLWKSWWESMPLTKNYYRRSLCTSHESRFFNKLLSDCLMYNWDQALPVDVRHSLSK